MIFTQNNNCAVDRWHDTYLHSIIIIYFPVYEI